MFGGMSGTELSLELNRDVFQTVIAYDMASGCGVPRDRRKRKEWAPVASSLKAPEKVTGALSNLRLTGKDVMGQTAS